jgi:hypothetical protein
LFIGGAAGDNFHGGPGIDISGYAAARRARAR